MTQRDKLIERLRQRPKGVTLDELDRVLRMFGFELVRISGSHHIYRRPGSPPITVTRHGAHVHSEAVREVLRIVDELLAER